MYIICMYIICMYIICVHIYANNDNKLFTIQQYFTIHTTYHAQTLKMLQTTKKEISTLFQAMPRDLQQTLLSAPHRASLIQVCFCVGVGAGVNVGVSRM